MAERNHHQVLVVGGGAAGITVAATLRRRARRAVDIAIVEPSLSHYYQPAFTLVGAGAYSLAATRRDTQHLVPRNVTWIHDAVAGFEPDHNRVRLRSGGTLTYDYLIVCAGLELNWEKIAGLREALGRHNVASNYSPAFTEYTWTALQGVKAGARLLFTQPPLPFKCPGAPQKAAYLAADYLRRKGLLEHCEVHFLTAAPAIFGVPYYAKALVEVAARYGIRVHYQHNLTGIDAAARKATFVATDKDGLTSSVSADYDFIHVTPPQSAPQAIRSSPLANPAGFVDVHQHTLQHNRFANVWGLGDCGSSPNSKTAAAVRKQAPVVVRGLIRQLEGDGEERIYDGYASCPLTTAYGKVLMAEFIYGGKVAPTFPLDPSKERRSMWVAKKVGLPALYWNYMLKGREAFPAHDAQWQE